MKTLILLRGLPGSGKSSLANHLFNMDMYSTAHFEADAYFIDSKNAKYKFDASKLPAAHEWCRNNTEQAMVLKEHNILVSNTFTTEKEMIPYYALAEKYKYRVISLIVENRHGGVSEHNVPDETLVKMKNRFNVKL